MRTLHPKVDANTECKASPSIRPPSLEPGPVTYGLPDPLAPRNKGRRGHRHKSVRRKNKTGFAVGACPRALMGF